MPSVYDHNHKIDLEDRKGTNLPFKAFDIFPQILCFFRNKPMLYYNVRKPFWIRADLSHTKYWFFYIFFWAKFFKYHPRTMQLCFIVPRINFLPQVYAFSQLFLAKTLGSRRKNISLSAWNSISKGAIWLVNFRAKSSRSVFLLFYIRQKLIFFLILL